MVCLYYERVKYASAIFIFKNLCQETQLLHNNICMGLCRHGPLHPCIQHIISTWPPSFLERWGVGLTTTVTSSINL